MFVHGSVGLYVTKRLALRLVAARRHGETAAYARVRHWPAGGWQSDQSGRETGDWKPGAGASFGKTHVHVLLQTLLSIHVSILLLWLRGGDSSFCLLTNQCFVSLTESERAASASAWGKSWAGSLKIFDQTAYIRVWKEDIGILNTKSGRVSLEAFPPAACSWIAFRCPRCWILSFLWGLIRQPTLGTAERSFLRHRSAFTIVLALPFSMLFPDFAWERTLHREEV